MHHRDAEPEPRWVDGRKLKAELAWQLDSDEPIGVTRHGPLTNWLAARPMSIAEPEQPEEDLYGGGDPTLQVTATIGPEPPDEPWNVRATRRPPSLDEPFGSD